MIGPSSKGRASTDAYPHSSRETRSGQRRAHMPWPSQASATSRSCHRSAVAGAEGATPPADAGALTCASEAETSDRKRFRAAREEAIAFADLLL